MNFNRHVPNSYKIKDFLYEYILNKLMAFHLISKNLNKHNAFENKFLKNIVLCSVKIWLFETMVELKN